MKMEHCRLAAQWEPVGWQHKRESDANERTWQMVLCQGKFKLMEAGAQQGCLHASIISRGPELGLHWTNVFFSG